MKKPLVLRSGSFLGAELHTVGKQKGLLVAAAIREGKTVSTFVADLLHDATEDAREEIEQSREEQA